MTQSHINNVGMQANDYVKQCNRHTHHTITNWVTVSRCYCFFFLSSMQRGQYHFPFGFVVRPTQAKWNHSIGHCNTNLVLPLQFNQSYS